METTMAQGDVLLITTVDTSTQHSLARAAAALQASTPALTRHVLTGVAPLLAKVAEERKGDAGTTFASVQLYARLIQGDVMVGPEARCPLTPEAMRVHEAASQQVARAYALLERAQNVYTDARVAVERARASRVATPAVSPH